VIGIALAPSAEWVSGIRSAFWQRQAPPSDPCLTGSAAFHFSVTLCVATIGWSRPDKASCLSRRHATSAS